MKNLHTFGEFLNEGKTEKSSFDPKLFYLVGKTESGKYDFNIGGFKSKTDRDGKEEGQIPMHTKDSKQ
jgi:hypothetical protein